MANTDGGFILLGAAEGPDGIRLEQLRRGGVSECRNKALQQMFQMIGGGKRAGSGFDKIQSGWRGQHWRAPRLRTQLEPDRVILAMQMVNLIPEATLAALELRLGDPFRTMSPPQVQALATAHLEGEVSNVRLQELLPDHPVDITRLLQGLCEQGFLVSDQKRRWTRYRLPALPAAELPLFSGVGGTVAPVSTTSQDSEHSARNSAHITMDSAHLAGDSKHSGADPAALRDDAQRSKAFGGTREGSD